MEATSSGEYLVAEELGWTGALSFFCLSARLGAVPDFFSVKCILSDCGEEGSALSSPLSKGESGKACFAGSPLGRTFEQAGNVGPTRRSNNTMMRIKLNPTLLVTVLMTQTISVPFLGRAGLESSLTRREGRLQ